MYDDRLLKVKRKKGISIVYLGFLFIMTTFVADAFFVVVIIIITTTMFIISFEVLLRFLLTFTIFDVFFNIHDKSYAEITQLDISASFWTVLRHIPINVAFKAQNAGLVSWWLLSWSDSFNFVGVRTFHLNSLPLEFCYKI